MKTFPEILNNSYKKKDNQMLTLIIIGKLLERGLWEVVKIRDQRISDNGWDVRRWKFFGKLCRGFKQPYKSLTFSNKEACRRSEEEKIR